MDLTLQQAQEKGIIAPYAVKFMPYDEVNGHIVPNFRKAAETLAQDAAMSTIPNIGAPSVLYTYLDPRIIEVLFAIKGAAKFFAPTQVGSWTDETAVFAVEEISGQVSPYNDFSDGVASDVNYNYPQRANFRFQTTIKYGELESEKTAVAKIALAARKQYAASEIIARAENRFYLYGVAGIESYGMLNDPNLPESISPVTVNTKSTWADKSANDPTNFANVAFNDINALIAELTANNGGNIDVNSDRMILGISNKMITYLTTPNSFGITALKMLKDNYPGLEVIQLPELSTSAGEMLYLAVPSLLGDETAVNAFSAKFKLGRLVPGLTSFKQKASAGTWGCVIKRPHLVATMLGI